MEKNEQQKLSYEELEKVAAGLQSDNQVLMSRCNQMAEKLKELSDFTAFKRLDYLFKVVESDNKFPAEFVTTCTEEIVSSITIPEETADDKIKKLNSKEQD